MFCWGWTRAGWRQGGKGLTAEQERVAGTGAKVWGHLVDGELRVWLKGRTEAWGQLCDKLSWKKLQETNKQTKLKLVSGPCFKFHLSNYFFPRSRINFNPPQTVTEFFINLYIKVRTSGVNKSQTHTPECESQHLQYVWWWLRRVWDVGELSRPWCFLTEGSRMRSQRFTEICTITGSCGGIF